MFQRFKQLHILSLALVVGLAACSDTNGPAGDFSPTEAAVDLQAAEAAFETPAFQSMVAIGDNLEPGMAPMIAGSIDLLAAADDRGSTADRALRGGRRLQQALAYSSASAPIPGFEQYYGTTFEFVPGEGHYVATEREGAPATGVRFILYAVSPITGDIVTEPELVEIGYADIIDENPEPDNQISARLIVVSEGIEYANYTTTATLGSPNGLGAEVVVAGTLTDGVTTANFTLTHSVNVNFVGGQVVVDYDISVPEEMFGLELHLDVQGEEGSATSTIELTVTHEGNTAMIAGTLTNEGGTLNVTVNGRAWAVITVSETGMEATDAEGNPLTEEEAQSLRRLFEVVEEVLEVFEDLFNPVEWVFDEAQ